MQKKPTGRPLVKTRVEQQQVVGRCVLIRFHGDQHPKMAGCIGWEEAK